jgi:hypothetical protein
LYYFTDLDGDLADDDGLAAVREELVDEGEKRAGDEAHRPHPERPYRQRRVIGRRHRQPDLLHRRHIVLVGPSAAGWTFDLHMPVSLTEVVLLGTRSGVGHSYKYRRMEI